MSVSLVSPTVQTGKQAAHREVKQPKWDAEPGMERKLFAATCPPSNGSRRPSFLASAGGCCLPAVLGLLWLMDASFQSSVFPWRPPCASLCLPRHLPSLPLCLCIQISPLRRTPVVLNRSLPIDLILTWLNLQRPYFQVRSHSEVPRIKTSMCLF